MLIIIVNPIILCIIKRIKYKDSNLFYSNNNYNYQNDFFAQNKITYNLNNQNNKKL